MSFCVAETVSGSSGGRPGDRPRFRAAAIPSRVRSEISRRSKCAIAPKTWNTSSPAAKEVSRRSSTTDQVDPTRLEVVNGFEQLAQRASQPVEPGHAQAVSRSGVVDQLREAGPIRALSRGGLIRWGSSLSPEPMPRGRCWRSVFAMRSTAAAKLGDKPTETRYLKFPSLRLFNSTPTHRDNLERVSTPTR